MYYRRNIKQFGQRDVWVAIHIMRDVIRPSFPVLRIMFSDLLDRHLRRISARFDAHLADLVLKCSPSLVVIAKNRVSVLIGSDLAGKV